MPLFRDLFSGLAGDAKRLDWRGFCVAGVAEGVVAGLFDVNAFKMR